MSESWLRQYERIARRFYAGIYNYLRWCCHDAELAADLTQETFLQIWRHPPEMRGEVSLQAWVYRIARNEYLQLRRRAGVATVALEDTLEPEQVGEDPQLHLEQADFSHAVLGAVDHLPEIYREVILLHNLEGLSLEEVGEVLEIPKGTVKSRRAKAFRLLRNILSPEVSCDEVHQST